MSTLLETLGWIGAVTLIVAYALVSYGRVRGSSVMYQALNIAGSVLLAANTAWHHAWPSVIVNVVWAMIAIGALFTA